MYAAEVKEEDVVLGYYDVIGKVETSSHKELEKIISKKEKNPFKNLED